nr:ferric reduction oxidase 4 [Quercus suber]
MVLTKHRVLSREEEAELLQSKKKLKDVHHADFNDGPSDGGQSQSHQNAWGSPKASVKDKLFREILGAFVEAFDFTDLMEDDAESDNEVADLWEGLAAAKLSKETKLQIRGPWTQTLIIKLLDCVDLGHDFYFVHFTLEEDMDSVLEKGPWFIGGNFQSIRPWEPFFKPTVANVSSIAVWVCLHELLLELYEMEVLKRIGEAIGKVLRIDAQTAMEARGKYARIGHKKDDCPHIIRSSTLLVKEGNNEHGDSVGSRMMHGTDGTTSGSGMSEGSGAATDNNSYRHWMIVTRKKAGQRGSRNSMALEGPIGSGRSLSYQASGQGPSMKPITWEVEGGVEDDLFDDRVKYEAGVPPSYGSKVGEDAQFLGVIYVRWVVTGGGAEDSMEDDSLCNGKLTCHQAESSVQADPGVQHALISKGNEHGGFEHCLAGEDIPIPVGDDAAAADVPPSPSADFDVRRTLETVMTVQQAHGKGSLPIISSPITGERAKKMSMETALRMIFIVLFLGWLMVWVLLPTKTYKQAWTPKLKIKLNSSYFGEQGTNLLLFTFPMMFIAALSCVYLHIQKKPKNFNSKSVVKSNLLAFWRRPLLVMAPLGIVTAMELAFAAMFVVLLIWSLSNYLYVSFGHLHMHKAGEKVWQAKFRSVSLRLGYVGNICWAFLFFPVSRGSSILPLIGITSESSIKYHIWLGHLSMILFAAHAIGFIIYWAMTNQMAEMLQWRKNGVPNVAGEIAIVFAMAMWVTSFPRVRRKMFEVFFYTHHLYTLYIFFYVLHVGSSYFCMILPGIFLFLVDRFLRFLQSRQRARLDSARLLPSGIVELNFSKSQGLTYNPTSTLFINVPSISKLQWHPFTVTSNCNMEPDRLSIVIKREGRWSQKLYQELSSSVGHLNVSLEGPYGPTSSPFLRHESLVMVSGGSGITPFISIIREIIFRSQSANLHIPRVLLICAFKNSGDLTMLDLLLPISGTHTEISKMQFQIEAYVTRENEQTFTESQKLLQTIWFKSDPSDSPVSATVGPNNWLWLGAIISSSFVMFLLFLGIVTRYYIFPIEHKTNETYHFTLRALWDMFLVCICIFIASSAIFLWCKKQNAMEVKPNLNLEVPTPTTSPGSHFHVADRELESLPHQSLVQATKVHFGSRPDLKEILSECKGSDIGVLVCGPRKMRHEVAKICSSGLADKLHLESISFNW